MYYFFCRTCGMTLLREYFTKPRHNCELCGDCGWRKNPPNAIKLRYSEEHGSNIDAKTGGEDE